MNRLLAAALVVAGLLANATFASESHAAAPACVNALMSGLGEGCYSNLRTMKLVIHRKDNSWVSFSKGTFAKNAAGNAATWQWIGSGAISQQFSGRLQSSCSVAAQDFSVSNSDAHRVEISASTGAITIINDTWGFSNVLTNTTCSGNIITASDSVHTFTISFGQLFNQSCF